MPIITLPDGSQKIYQQPVTVYEIASSIGSGLANAAIAGNVNGNLIDTCIPITKDSTLKIITSKDKEGIDIIISMDASGSMLAQDFKPNRFEILCNSFIEGGSFIYSIIKGSILLSRSNCSAYLLLPHLGLWYNVYLDIFCFAINYSLILIYFY